MKNTLKDDDDQKKNYTSPLQFMPDSIISWIMLGLMSSIREISTFNNSTIHLINISTTQQPNPTYSTPQSRSIATTP
jgi:hypothetical protein